MISALLINSKTPDYLVNYTLIGLNCVQCFCILPFRFGETNMFSECVDGIRHYTTQNPQLLFRFASSSVIGWPPTAFHMEKIKSYFIQQCLLYSLKVITWMHCNEWFGCIKHYTSVAVLYLSTEIGPQNGPETILLPFGFNFTIKLVVIICFDIIFFINY